ncbi:hypothetical protein DL96DRAFT_1788288 [Flagelloscypha sp. PMI_526]|nr:hypothetical protein DL96DRAFT_1788288 [Flagelloscypha sp. PMI_526]
MAETEDGIRVISFGILSFWLATAHCLMHVLDGSALDASGLSELFILEDIAGKWAWDRERDDRDGGDVRLSELCDIVGGTGIGGRVETRGHYWMHDFAEDGSSTNRRRSWLRIEPGQPISFEGLAQMVCYQNRNREAIRATLADGIHLPPVDIQDEEFVMASSGFANPSYELMKELPAVFPKGSRLSSFVSLGAGRSHILSATPGKRRQERVERLLYAERVAENLATLCAGLGPCYFRLCAATGADSADLLADVAIRVIKSITLGYLDKEEVRVRVEAVVEILAMRHGVVSLERIGSLAAEDGRGRLNAQVEAVRDHVIHVRNAIDDDIYCKIKNWLTPIDQTAKLDAYIRTRSPSTCSWLWNSPQIVEWRRLGGIFWCHAGMGAGKTIIASHVIETLMTVPDDCFAAYYYFEFTNPSTLSEEGLFRSLIFQLSHANAVASQRMYEQHRNGSLQPQLTTLRKFLYELIKGAPIPVYIIIDALDELPSPQRKYLIESLHELSSLATNGVLIMTTSRDEVDIHEGFTGKVSIDFAIEKEMVCHDIAVFVDRELSAKKWKFWPKEEVLNMRNILISKADGMFRMIACQMQVLNQAQSTEDMRQALASLPTTLGDVYLYILGTIPSHLQSRAHTLLCVLSVAFEPVSVVELSELLAVELGDPTDPINLPTYREDLRYHEPQNIIGLGTALVRRTELGNNDVVLQLSHASVKEFLLRGNRSWCALDEELAHETTARACLALLIYNEDPRHVSGIADIWYTRSNWRRHVQSNHRVQLLSQQQKLFETFPWTRSSIGEDWTHLHDYSEMVAFLMSPLIFAAAFNLEELLLSMLASSSNWKAKELNKAMDACAHMGSSIRALTALIEKGADVNSLSKYGIPILHNAAHRNQLRVVQVLLEHGADVDMVGERYGSPLQAAAEGRALDVVKFLVGSGADVNKVGGWYGSPLQAAAKNGNLDVIKLLVEGGADVNIHGESYGFLLQILEYNWELPLQEKQEVIAFLTGKGAVRSVGPTPATSVGRGGGAGSGLWKHYN